MSYFIIALLLLAWRIFLFVPLVASQFFLAPRLGYEYTLLPYFLEKGSFLSNFLIYPFGSFDAVHYLRIAAQGYDAANTSYFPLLPMTVNISSRLFGSNILPFDVRQYFVAIVLVSMLFIASLFIFIKLIKLDYKKNIAMWSVVFLLIFPTSFFFNAIYSESLFLLLALSSFYLARKKKWFWAGIVGAMLSATRIVGIAIFPALLYEYFKYEKSKSLWKLLTIFLSPLGLIAYIIYNIQRWGNPFYFIQTQGNFQNNRSVDSIILFPQTMFRYAKILTTVKPVIYEWWVALFELTFFIFGLILFYIAWKKKIRFSYLIFGALCFLIPASSGTFTSFPRYLLPIFPLFITLGLIQNKLFKIIYLPISIILLFIFFMLFSKGYFIS